MAACGIGRWGWGVGWGKEGLGRGFGDSQWTGGGPCGRRQAVNREEIYSLLCCRGLIKIQTHLSY